MSPPWREMLEESQSEISDHSEFFVASMGLRTDLVAFSRADPSKPIGFAQLTPIDGEIWLSSFNGGRVAYGPIPR